MAVFTLPPELIPLYKEHLEYISAHAVDPDKRRYATKHEGSRHYIDLDHWGTFPYDTLPRDWISALDKLIVYHCLDSQGDTVLLKINHDSARENRNWIYGHILPQFYEDRRVVNCDSLQAYFDSVECQNCTEIIVSEQLSAHGILPYHLVKVQRNLTEAMRQGNIERILSLSADFGHYIADAHVPLHTTRNYDGQLSGQKGIHAFWESRIPELFADQYDFLTGRAVYIDNPVHYYWNIVLQSNALVDSVLTIESKLSNETATDKQFCFSERSETILRSQCVEFAKAYESALHNMVERRMRAAVHAVGSAWFTAWVDAGQPHLHPSHIAHSDELENQLQNMEKEYRLGKIKGRAH